jgi:hypothetical protein
MGMPQILVIAHWVIEIVGCAILHGRPKSGSYNFLASFICVVIEIAVLWYGGFFG